MYVICHKLQRYTRNKHSIAGDKYIRGLNQNMARPRIPELVAVSIPGQHVLFPCLACAFHGGPDPASVGFCIFRLLCLKMGSSIPPCCGHLTHPGPHSPILECLSVSCDCDVFQPVPLPEAVLCCAMGCWFDIIYIILCVYIYILIYNYTIYISYLSYNIAVSKKDSSGTMLLRWCWIGCLSLFWSYYGLPMFTTHIWIGYQTNRFKMTQWDMMRSSVRI